MDKVGKQRVKKVATKLKVEKKAFDKVLGKLIQTAPIKRARGSSRGKSKRGR